MKLDVIYNEDCLLGMQRIPSESVDMILCDLPYGTTHNKWDSVISLTPMWEQYSRVLTTNGSVILTAAQPFTSILVSSNLPWFQYSLVWEKNIATGHLDARRRPMRKHEDVVVFRRTSYQSKASVYNPQMTSGDAYTAKRKKVNDSGSNYGAWNGVRTDTINEGKRYPVSVLQFDRETGLHPTQKPVALFEYLIRTYTNPGETVLDNCMGSGTTAIACINSGRHFIGFEKDHEYCAKAEHRILNHVAATSVTASVVSEDENKERLVA